MAPKNIIVHFSRNLLLIILMIIPIGVIFISYVRAEKRIDQAHNIRLISFNLAEELHQTSDNLTRMARTYVITGESKYKQQYHEVRDILNGKQPRPEQYWPIYWDLMVDDKRPRPARQELVPLLELMHRNGFTEQELAKLTESKQHSDQLALLEQKAMSLAESSGPGAEAKRASAVVMLHDLSYHQTKAAIMKPIDDFFVMVDKRTQEAVDAAARLAQILRVAFVAFALWLVFMLRWTFKALNETLGGSIEEVHSQIVRLGKGDFTSVEPDKDKKDNSIMGWLIETQTRLSVCEENRRKMSRAVEQSPVTIVITDSHGIIEFVNHKFTELTGYSAAEAIGLNPRIMKSGQTPPEVYNKIWSTISSGKVWAGELFNKGKDGTLFREHATISPLRDSHGAITHYLAIKEDITEKKKIMDQLLQSQKLESVGQLASGLAHDFNNILSIITGFAYIMKLESGSGRDQTEYIEQILAASARGAELTYGLLAYSRKQVLNLRHQNLNPLLSNTGSFILRLIGENIELSLVMKDDPLMVYIDSMQIEQALLNLATNARDAMPDGGKLSLTSAAGVIDEDYIRSHGFGQIGRYAVISVNDSGCGMNEQTMRSIFEPFFTTKAVGKGTGLGVSMVMGIVKQHNGFIDVKSAVGTGTTFNIYLPLLDKGVDPPDSERSKGYLPERGEGTILVAEDEQSVRDYMEKLLTMLGYTVVLAVDGQDAVEKFTLLKDEIQLVIFDMIMPRKSGKAAWSEIRQIDSSIKVIYISGYTEDIIERQGGLGQDEVLIRKPIPPKDLLGLVKEMIRHNR